MNYFSKLFSTGAIRETPQKVIETLLKQVGNHPVKTVIEIGVGKGELTAALLKNNLSFSDYYAFEIDDEACAHLHASFPQLTIKKTNAFDFANHLPPNQTVDLFISSIPLSFYPKMKIQSLLQTVKASLTEKGNVVIVFSAFWLIPVLKKQLPGGKLNTFFTFPPYFLYSYRLKNMR